MTGELRHGRALRGDLRHAADVVVCGSGAGGSMAARELARAGLQVVLLEEGGDHLPRHFTQREDEMIPELFQEAGGRRTDDLAVLILSGKGLGGSTVHNTNLCKRTAPEILAHWQDDLGLEGTGSQPMNRYFEAVERDLGVSPLGRDQMNRANELAQRGTERLGWRGGLLSHNRDQQCVGSGFCELGCAYDGKLNARRVLLPQAIEAGALVYSDTRVERVLHDGMRATGVEATMTDRLGRERGRVTVRARAVCLAGSAIGSAALALRSGVPDPHHQLGTNLRIHPAAVVAGVFDEEVAAWRGIPQSWECTEWLDLRPGSTRRVWLVPSFAHPVGTASLTPGFGPTLLRAMRRYPSIVAMAAMVHDETAGRVYVDGARARVAYVPTEADREQLALGARQAARLLLAAGAREVSIPAVPPMVVRRSRDLAAITSDRFMPHDAKLSAVHPMGSLRMGRDPATSVVDARGRHHHLRGLRVTDGSLFPTSIGGPPQLSVYAFSMKVARDLVEELRSG